MIYLIGLKSSDFLSIQDNKGRLKNTFRRPQHTKRQSMTPQEQKTFERHHVSCAALRTVRRRTQAVCQEDGAGHYYILLRRRERKRIN